MTIWYVRNRLDQPKATIANQKRNKSFPSSHVELFTSQTNQHHPLNVKWLRMHVNAFMLSHCWHLILYYAIIISVISQAPSPVYGYNGAVGSSSSKMLPTPAASMWSANFFDADRIQCPSFVDNSACPCYKLEDGKCRADFCSQIFHIIFNWPTSYPNRRSCVCVIAHFICCVSKFTWIRSEDAYLNDIVYVLWLSVTVAMNHIPDSTSLVRLLSSSAIPWTNQATRRSFQTQGQ